jgi:alpha-1,2-mannosyltransferase
VVWPPYGEGREYGWGPWEHLVGNAYLIAALALSAWAATTLIRSRGQAASSSSTVPGMTVAAQAQVSLQGR